MAQILLERLLHTLVTLRGPIRVDMYRMFLVCLIAVAFSTLACLLMDPLLSLSFGKEAGVPVQVSHLRDRSPPLVKVVFHIQVAEDEMMMQSTDLFRVTFQSPCEYLA